MRWDELSEQSCPVARGLSVIGDRWTLLILRDCFRGLRRFEQFQESLGVTRHVLADRLRKLEGAGVLRRELYQQRPPRHEYRLTEAGLELHPVLVSLVGWADRHIPAPDGVSMVYSFRDETAGAESPETESDAGGSDPGRPGSETGGDARAAPRRVEPMLVDRATGREITPRNLTARLRRRAQVLPPAD